MVYLKDKMPVVLLILLMLFITILNARWITMDTGEMYRTEQPKFVTVRSYIDKNFSYAECSYYPPGYFWMCAKTISLLKMPLSYDRCVFVNIFYLVLGMLGMFLLGRRLTSSDWHGLGASLLLLGVPVYLHISRKFIGEFAVTTCVIFAMYFLISNCRWQDKGKSLLFGIVCGIGMLFKWSFIAYIIGPLLVSIRYSYCSRKRDSRRDWLWNIFFGFLGALIVCGYWYLVRFDFFRFHHEFFSNLYDAEYISSSYFLFLSHNFSRSLQIFLLGGSWFFCLLVLIALVVATKKFYQRADYVMILSWFAFPYIIFLCFGGDILPRYILPVIPAAILIVVLAFFSSDQKKNMIFLVFLGFFSFGSIYQESFINRPAREYFQTKFDEVLKYICDNKVSKHIIFNGINDQITEGEVLDMYNLFCVYDIDRRLGLEIRYIKTQDDLMANIQAPFILSQDIFENIDVHQYIERNGYVVFDRFSHCFQENVNPADDWCARGGYILFEKKNI